MSKLVKLFLLFFTFASINSLSACGKNEAGSNSKNSDYTSAGNSSVYKVGDVVENFTLVTPSGGNVSLNDYDDKAAKVLIFWSVQCPVVQAYNDRVVALYNEYKDKGIVFIPIYSNTTESAEDIQGHSASNKYEFSVMVDKGYKIADMFGATKTPEVFLLNQKNVLIYTGRVDDSRDASKVSAQDLRNALDELLAGKEISVKETKSFGCSIKRD